MIDGCVLVGCCTLVVCWVLVFGLCNYGQFCLEFL